MFADDGSVPNNPEEVIEKVFRSNGWGDTWRNGIYPYVRMGVARVRAKVRSGGNKGQEIEITQGDVCVLPAGRPPTAVGEPRPMVIGAYPKTGKYLLCRGSKRKYTIALQIIPSVPLPDTDPVFGKKGPLKQLWRG
jgi:uncharacterized protein YjlB